MFKKKLPLDIDVMLKCPDGLYETVGFEIPREIDDFIKYVNAFHNKKGFSIKLAKSNIY